MFSILGATTVLYIAYRAYLIGNDVTEMKQLLTDIRRATQDQATAVTGVAPAAAMEPGHWPSVSDPAYNTELPYEIKQAESPH